MAEKPPRNGFRIYRSTDGTLRMDALVNGSPIPVEMDDAAKELAPGYYDEDLQPISDE